MAHELGISDEAIRKALAGFGGVKRRFTRTGEWNGVTVIDDYGHHPVEIAAVLKAARESTNGKIIAVVQPHRFTRLQSLFEEFCTCFNDADAVVVAEVYPAGEAPIEGIDRDHFVLGLRAHGHREVIPLPNSAELAGVVRGIAEPRRPRRLPRRRQHHAMGLRAARRTEGAGVAVTFPDITPDLKAAMPQLRGRLLANQSLAELTWFRVGGPAQVLFTPADEDDLAYFLKLLPKRIAGLCRRRRLQPDRARWRHAGRGDPPVAAGFGETSASGDIVSAGTAALDKRVAETAAAANIGGLEFFFGIPGTIGGALRMNAGANGSETKDVLIEAAGIGRDGTRHVFSNADMKFVYRNSGVDPSIIFTSARFRGAIADAEAIRARMNEVQSHRETAQPIREKTGGSTFKNPPGHSAWKLIDAAGCRGLRVGGAQVSEMHCNFLINTGNATGHDIETLGETVRERVKENSGIELHWEIKRIGIEQS